MKNKMDKELTQSKYTSHHFFNGILKKLSLNTKMIYVNNSKSKCNKKNTVAYAWFKLPTKPERAQ